MLGEFLRSSWNRKTSSHCRENYEFKVFFLQNKGRATPNGERVFAIILIASTPSAKRSCAPPFGGPKTPQDAPKTPQEGNKTPQDAPKTAQDAPKTPPRRPQDAPRDAQDSPRRPKTSPRRPKTRPKRSRTFPRRPKTPQDAPGVGE